MVEAGCSDTRRIPVAGIDPDPGHTLRTVGVGVEVERCCSCHLDIPVRLGIPASCPGIHHADTLHLGTDHQVGHIARNEVGSRDPSGTIDRDIRHSRVQEGCNLDFDPDRTQSTKDAREEHSQLEIPARMAPDLAARHLALTS